MLSRKGVIHVWMLLLAVFCITGSSNNGVANPNSVFVIDKARFSFLTEDLIRIEYSQNKVFEDRASLTFVNRNLPYVMVKHGRFGGCDILSSTSLTLQYCPKRASPSGVGYFTNETLSIVRKNGTLSDGFSWFPGKQNKGQLHGTVRTLDGVDGSVELDCSKQKKASQHCTEGVISKSGWVLVNDSINPLFDGSNWDWVVPRVSAGRKSRDIVDWYFFGHGLNFTKAIYDFTQVAGRIPLPPRYSFGVYFSRYWAYSDREEKDIVKQYVDHHTPLDILVIDMDWHFTSYRRMWNGKKDQAGQPYSWTGYTWDKHLFPHPEAFLNWTHSQNIRVTLNLHPASGVQPHELRYPEMARAMGIDPNTKKYVPFEIANKTFARNFFNIVLDPISKEGIDFWWLDWQQSDITSVPNLNPTFWLNYVFFSRYERTRPTRPMILHRWGGLGNHRYPLGFSGDTNPTWASLDFQPHFTLTAANVLFMWSHDIGGHMKPSPPELYTRWVQLGVFSPVFRTHCTKDPKNDRRIWTYPLPNFTIMRDAIELRARLIPYIYTAARIAHDTGLAICRPLYHHYSTKKEAYTAKNEYFFGNDIIAAPITQPIDLDTHLAERTIWIPFGLWVEWDSLRVFRGPRHVVRNYTLSEIPLFSPVGAVIPMRPKDIRLLGSAETPYDILHLKVFTSGGNGPVTSNNLGSKYSPSAGGILYEDAGNDRSDSYEINHTWTIYNIDEGDDKVIVQIGKTSPNDTPATRSYVIEFVSLLPPSSVEINGVAVEKNDFDDNKEGWHYDSSNLAVVVQLVNQISVQKTIIIKITKNSAYKSIAIGGIKRCFSRLVTVKQNLDNHFPSLFEDDYHKTLVATEIASSVDLQVNKLQHYGDLIDEAIAELKNIPNIMPDVLKLCVALLQNCYL